MEVPKESKNPENLNKEENKNNNYQINIASARKKNSPARLLKIENIIKTKKIEPKSSFSEKMNIELEKYFEVILINNEISEKVILFNKLFDEYKENKDFIFFLFWYPFINLDELMSIKILEITKIYFEKYTIDNIKTFSVSSKELNAFAFKTGLKNNFNDKMLSLIIKQGRIKLSMEWILVQIKLKNISFLEGCWKANNDCYFQTTELFKKFFELYRKSFFFEIKLNEMSFSDLNDSNTNLNLSYNNNNSNRRSNNNKNINSSKIITDESCQEEFYDFYSKNFGKFTLSKLILIANFYKETYEESIDNDKRDLFDNIIRAICIFGDKKYSDNFLEGLFISKNEGIAEELLEANLLNLDIKIFLIALQYKELRFCLQFHARNSDYKIFDNEKLHDDIIEKIFEDLNNLEIYLFLIENFSVYFTLNTMKTFTKKIEDILQCHNQSNKIINNFSNPIKIFVLIAEIFNRSKSRFPSLDSYINRLIQKCMDYSESIQNLIEDDSVFRELLFEKDIKKRSLLDIISSNNFMILLKNKIIEKIVDDLWNGPYEIQGNFLEVSGQYRSLNINTGSKDYDIYTKQRKTAFSKKKIRFLSNFTHFKVWQTNIYSKYFVEVLIGFLLLALTLFFSFYIVGDYKAILNYDKEILNTYTNFLTENLSKENFEKHKTFILNNRNTFDKEIFDNVNYNYFANNFSEVFDNLIKNNEGINLVIKNNGIDKETLKNILGGQNMFRNFFTRMVNIKYWFSLVDTIFTMFLLLPFEYILRIIYTIKVRQPSFGLTIFPDILIFIFSLMMKFIELEEGKFINKITENNSIEAIENFNFISSFKTFQNVVINDPLNQEITALSILSALIWVRFILLIRGTKTFGPLIVIFLVSLKGVLKYVILFVIATFAYSSVAYLIFYKIGNYLYANPFYTFMYFYLFSLGGDSGYESYYELAKENGYISYESGIFIVIVLILNVIVFFNLMIALLSNIFETYKNYSLQLYIQKKLEIRKKFYDDEDRFNSLLVSYFPLSIFTFPFAFALLFMVDERRTKKLNKFIMYLNYSIYAILYLISFTIITIFLVPISYLNIAFSKFLQIFIDEIQQYFKIYKVCSFFFFLSFGILFQVKSFVSDLYLFFTELWKKNIPLTTDAENRGKYSIRSSLLEVLIKMIIKIYEKPSAIQQKIKETSIMRKTGESILNFTSKEDQENYVDPLSLKISLDKIIFLISRYIDPNLDHKAKLNLNIFDYTYDKEKKQKNENGDFEEANFFNFSMNYETHHNNFRSLGYDYNELLDYLFNFCDDKYILDLPTLINILITSYKFYQIKVYYMNISDKNLKNYTSKKQAIFYEKVDEVMKLEKRESSIKKDFVNGLSESNNNNQIEGYSSSNLNNQNENNQFKLSNIYKKKSSNFGSNIKFSKIEKKKQVKRSLIKKQSKRQNYNYLMKINKGKNLFKLPDFLSLPIISRQSIILFYDDLKEFQTDLSKKINFNIIKNQRYLEEINISNKGKKYLINNQENSDTILNKKIKNTIGSKNLFLGIDRDEIEKKLESSPKKIKKETLPLSIQKNSIKIKNKKHTSSLSLREIPSSSFEERLNNIENKLEKILLVTEKLANELQISNRSEIEELDEEYSESSSISSDEDTLVIDKFDDINLENL